MNRMHPDTVDRLCDNLMIDQYTLAAIWEISGWEPEEQILGDRSDQHAETEFMRIWRDGHIDGFDEHQSKLIVAGRAMYAATNLPGHEIPNDEYYCWGADGEYALNLDRETYMDEKLTHYDFRHIENIREWIDDYRKYWRGYSEWDGEAK